jgi:hypothetical protein
LEILGSQQDFNKSYMDEDQADSGPADSSFSKSRQLAAQNDPDSAQKDRPDIANRSNDIQLQQLDSP